MKSSLDLIYPLLLGFLKGSRDFTITDDISLINFSLAFLSHSELVSAAAVCTSELVADGRSGVSSRPPRPGITTAGGGLFGVAMRLGAGTVGVMGMSISGRALT